MSNLSIDKRDLICNKASCLRIAAQAFLKNKKTARVCIEEFSRNVFITYTGARDLESIVEGMKVQRVIER